ncbi:MAG TPA: hypothetical protein VKV15_14150 [Bryobacteraceae bacterium]|nr:hypothetical protein [Bryobacteraceae bacterium]
MNPDDPAASQSLSLQLSHHQRILGVCWVLYGILRLATAVCLALFANTLTVMFGALLNRVSDPFSMMSGFHFVYALIVVMCAVCGIIGVLAGLALISGARSGRTLALIAGFLSLWSIPLGTTLGIYTLIVLLTWTARPVSATAGVPVSHLRSRPA